jgi:glycosidase
MKFYTFLLCLLFFIFACKDKDPASTGEPSKDTDPPAYGTPYTGTPDTRDLVFYQVNMRAFSEAGTFKGVEARLDSVKALGVNVIWLMPICPVGKLRSAGGLGSPYAVQDYEAVNPEFGTLTDLQELVAEAHKRRMAVVVDWVANHTAWDHAWLGTHPDWYTRDAAGNVQIPAGTNWNDVADLNFTNAEMRLSMIKAMKYWVLRANIDGFRCDAADFVPFDFWKQALDTLKNMPGRSLILLAEGARRDHYQAGFQLNYGWDFYGRTKNVYANGQSAATLAAGHTSEYSGLPAGVHLLRFTTNHDESAWDDSPIVLLKGQRGAMSAFVVTAFMGGVPLLYNGQETGRATKTPFFTKSPIDWKANPAYFDEYKRVMAVRQAHLSVLKGAAEDYSTAQVVAFRRKNGNNEFLVLANTRNVGVALTLPTALTNTSWKNALTEAPVSLGTAFSLSPYQYLLLKK